MDIDYQENEAMPFFGGALQWFFFNNCVYHHGDPHVITSIKTTLKNNDR